MNKFYVTKDVAEKLRAKGYYREYDVTDEWVEGIFYQVEDGTFHLPRIDEVLAWLREEKKIHVIIATFVDQLNRCYTWGYEIWNISEFPKHIQHVSVKTNFTGHDKAAIAGIEYVIDNLI